MKTKPKWAKSLSAKELNHLADTSSTGRPLLRDLKENLKAQNNGGAGCWECKSIARKLNLDG